MEGDIWALPADLGALALWLCLLPPVTGCLLAWGGSPTPAGAGRQVAGQGMLLVLLLGKRLPQAPHRSDARAARPSGLAGHPAPGASGSQGRPGVSTGQRAPQRPGRGEAGAVERVSFGSRRPRQSHREHFTTNSQAPRRPTASFASSLTWNLVAVRGRPQNRGSRGETWGSARDSGPTVGHTKRCAQMSLVAFFITVKTTQISTN